LILSNSIAVVFFSNFKQDVDYWHRTDSVNLEINVILDMISVWKIYDVLCELHVANQMLIDIRPTVPELDDNDKYDQECAICMEMVQKKGERFGLLSKLCVCVCMLFNVHAHT
jgi:hypothetical protein